jgi:hypothetical protein
MLGLTMVASVGGFCVSEVAPAARRAWEEAAAAASIPLALSDLELWNAIGFSPASTLFTVHDSSGSLAGGFAVQRWPSRALPGHRILRVEHLGESIPSGAEAAMATAVVGLARRTPRVLRVDAHLHDRDSVRRARLANALQAAGFQRRHPPRSYERTLAIELQRDDEALLGSFSERARRQIRYAEHLPLSVLPIQDPALTPQLERLHRETFARTGMRPLPQPWAKLIAATRIAPDRVGVFGVVLAEQEAAYRLVAYARVLRHGTFAVYDDAGSTRLPDRRVPLMYPAVWTLLRWARDHGAIWFDFGGLSSKNADTGEDPLAGISEFKRNFGGEDVIVGEEWSFDAAPLRQRLIQSLRRQLAALTPHRG